jgi:acyl carrier protein
MIDSGVTDLVLTGLRARDRSAVQDLERDGVRIDVVAADASDRAAMTALVDSIAARGKVLKGIVHLAGVPEETAIVDGTYERGRRVMAPKVAGGWIVHDISRHLPLDFFVSFSSISAVWGSRGQPFYGAANHFLDALTAYRRLSGLPMVTVSWGPWSEGGMVDGDGLARLERMGLRAMPPPHAIDKLARLVAAASEQRVVVDVDWLAFKELFESRGERPILSRVGKSAMQAGRTETGLARELRALSPDAAHARVCGVVRASVMSSLGWAEDRVLEARRGFFDLGMDSLMALDLKNRLQDAFGLPLRATVVFNYSTVESLADFLAQQFVPASGRAAAGDDAPATAKETAETLSDEDALKFFDEQLAAIEPGDGHE